MGVLSKRIWLYILILAGLPRSAWAESVTLVPIKDNTLIEDAEGDLSNGAGEHLFAGRTAQADSSSRRRALIAFDLAGAIPPDSAIIAVRLILNLSKTSSGAHAVALHRVLADWGEAGSNATGDEGGGAPAQIGDATWRHRTFNTVQWSQAGGDYAAAASATMSVSALGQYTWSSPAMLSDVQSWHADPAQNFGWILIGNESASGSSKRFDSRQNGTPASRPRLEIDFGAMNAARDWALYP